MKYDALYFLKKFDAIPDEKWMLDDFCDFKAVTFCALGHCGESLSGPTLESYTLNKILNGSAAEINDGVIVFKQDGTIETKKLGNTPKERIMNALLLVNAGVGL